MNAARLFALIQAPMGYPFTQHVMLTTYITSGDDYSLTIFKLFLFINKISYNIVLLIHVLT